MASGNNEGGRLADIGSDTGRERSLQIVGNPFIRD